MTRKTIITLSAVAVLALVAVGTVLFLLLRNSPTQTPLTISASPLEIELSIDGEDYGTVEDGQTLVIEARDQIEVVASYEGFETYTSTAEINPGEESELAISLMPETEEAWELLETQGELEGERRGTEMYLEEAESAYEDHPILHELPEEQTYFRAAQGISESGDNDWAIHLYLYAGHEDEGRSAFEEFLADQEVALEDYEIIEHIEDQAPPSVIAEAPTADELQAAEPPSIPEPDQLSTEGLSAEELAFLFAESTTTWDAAEDEHPHAGLIRAETLMTEDLADEIAIPENLMTTPVWRDAASAEAVSTSWVHYIEEGPSEGGDHQFTVDVCWAWVTGDTTPVIDGPRAYELTISEDGENFIVSEFTYDDPDPFVDNSQGACQVS